MSSFRQVRDNLGNTLCRSCISRAYHINLQPKDCDYGIYPSLCDRCGEMKNIVVGLSGSGKMKLFFR